MTTIQIINKNNNTIYNVTEPVVMVSNYNEELDSVHVTLAHLTSPIDIEPFDKVILYDDRLNYRYYEVDTYERQQVGINPKNYNYNITLFSETKELEGIILPNLTITPSKMTSPKSLYEVMNDYLIQYGPLIKVGSSSSWNYTSKFIFADRVRTKFNDVDCPELQWNNPTLREVLTTLMMIKDCIPIVRNNVIDYIDISTVKQDITSDTRINYITETQSSADYVSEIQSTMTNVLQTSVNGVKNTVSTREILTFQADEDGWVITDQNILLKTSFPILNIKHLWIYLGFSYKSDQSLLASDLTRYKRIDLCNVNGYNLVKEYNEYRTLNIDFTLKLNETFEYYSKKQNYCLFFNRYGNTINGFSNQSKLLLWFTSTWLEWVNKVFDGVGNQSNNTYFANYFEIEYETTADMIYRASKGVKPANDRIIIDQQDFSFVDANSHGRLELQKANRLGNKQMMLNARYDGEIITGHIIEEGDYYLDSDGRKNIVYKVEYQIFNDHINVNAYLTKDYVLRNYFTGVKSKIRTWVNAKDEAQQRHDIQKTYCVLSYNQINDDKNAFTSNTNLAYYMLSPLWSNDIKPIKYVATRTAYDLDRFPPRDENNNYQWYMLDCISRVVGNSLVLTFGYQDNYYVNKHPAKFDNDGNAVDFVSSDFVVAETGLIATAPRIDLTITGQTGGIALSPYTYVNEEGNFNTISYIFLNDFEEIELEGVDTVANVKDKIVKIFKLPLAKESMLPNNARKIYNTIVMEKDNKEIPYISTQFEFLTDTRDIVIGQKFVQYQEAIRTIANPQLRYYSDVGDLQEELPYDAIEETNISITTTSLTNYKARIELTKSSGYFQVNTNYYVCDQNNNVLFAYKCKLLSNISLLYLNILRQRNTNIYQSQDNQRIVGTIEEE